MTVRPLFALLLAGLLPTAHAADPVTVATVGDADSFGRNVHWLGLMSGAVRLSLDCTPDPADPAPLPCATLSPAPAATAFDFPDLDSIDLPARSTTSLICHWQTPVASFYAGNDGAGPQQFNFRLTPYYTIYSDVLDGLADPFTGVPYAGRIELPLTAAFVSATLQSGDSRSDLISGTRMCIGGLITRRSLMGQWGLTSAQATQFFREPVRITLGIRGNGRLLQDANITVGTRLTGD